MNRIKKALLILGTAVGIMATPITALAGSDNTPPTLNAAVNNGLLTINAVDESGIEVIYVNGFEFFDPKDGNLTIRLEKFEAGVQTFTISAMDRAGNKSQDYVISNPYWVNPNDDSNNNNENPAEQLPASATATDPSSATGDVTEHDFYYLADNPGYSREFYTIETESGKVFYLIIENEGDDRTVHFLTDINENDLLNTTENNSETLPKNSIGATSTVPVQTVQLPTDEGTVIEVKPDGTKTETDSGNNAQVTTNPVVNPQTQTVSADAEDIKADEEAEPAVKKSNPLILYGGGGLLLFGILYYLKIGKKKGKASEDFVEDEEEAEAQEEYLTEDDEDDTSDGVGYFDREQADDDFFDEVDPEEDE